VGWLLAESSDRCTMVAVQTVKARCWNLVSSTHSAELSRDVTRDHGAETRLIRATACTAGDVHFGPLPNRWTWSLAEVNFLSSFICLISKRGALLVQTLVRIEVTIVFRSPVRSHCCLSELHVAAESTPRWILKSR
jgi:hypothetical protein